MVFFRNTTISFVAPYPLRHTGFKGRTLRGINQHSSSQLTTCEDILSWSSCFSTCQGISDTSVRCADFWEIRQFLCHLLSLPGEFYVAHIRLIPKFYSVRPYTPS